MPLYEYRCTKCGSIIELFQSNAIPRRFCGDECKAEGKPGDGELERLISAAALPSSVYQGDKVDYEKAAAKGLTAYKRAEKGVYEKIAGGQGPDQLKDR